MAVLVSGPILGSYFEYKEQIMPIAVKGKITMWLTCNTCVITPEY